MEKRTIRRGNKMDITVEISQIGNRGNNIKMSMREYKDFIKEQSQILGITDEDHEEKEEGYEMTLEAVKIPQELIDMIMSTKPEEAERNE